MLPSSAAIALQRKVNEKKKTDVNNLPTIDVDEEGESGEEKEEKEKYEEEDAYENEMNLDENEMDVDELPSPSQSPSSLDEDQSTTTNNNNNSETEIDDADLMLIDDNKETLPAKRKQRKLRIICARMLDREYKEKEGISSEDISKTMSGLRSMLAINMKKISDPRLATNADVIPILTNTFIFIVINCCDLLGDRYRIQEAIRITGPPIKGGGKQNKKKIDSEVLSEKMQWKAKVVGWLADGEQNDPTPKKKASDEKVAKRRSVKIIYSEVEASDLKKLILLLLLSNEYRKDILDIAPFTSESDIDQTINLISENLRTKNMGVKSLMLAFRYMHTYFFTYIWSQVKGTIPHKLFNHLFVDPKDPNKIVPRTRVEGENDYYRGMRFRQYWKNKINCYHYDEIHLIKNEMIVNNTKETISAMTVTASPCTPPSFITPTNQRNRKASMTIRTNETPSPSYVYGASPIPIDDALRNTNSYSSSPSLLNAQWIVGDFGIKTSVGTNRTTPFLWIQLLCMFMEKSFINTVRKELAKAIQKYACHEENDIIFTIPGHKKILPFFRTTGADDHDEEVFVPAFREDAVPHIMDQLNQIAASENGVKLRGTNPIPAFTPEQTICIPASNLPPYHLLDLSSPGSVFFWTYASNGIVCVVKLKEIQVPTRDFDKMDGLTLTSNLGTVKPPKGPTKKRKTVQSDIGPPLYQPPETLKTLKEKVCQADGCEQLWEFVDYTAECEDKIKLLPWLGCETLTCHRYFCKHHLKNYPECTEGMAPVAPNHFFCPFCVYCHADDCKGFSDTTVSPLKNRSVFGMKFPPRGEKWPTYTQCEKCQVVYHWQCAVNIVCRYCKGSITRIE